MSIEKLAAAIDRGQRPIESGFRLFACECSHEWIEHSRDRHTPSGDDCANCGEWVQAVPADAEDIERLKT
jgi:hypothetical protein